MINRLRNCKKGKARRSLLVHYENLLTMSISPALFPAVTVTVVRDRKIRTALRTNQIARFVTVPSWEKINRYNGSIATHERVHTISLAARTFRSSNKKNPAPENSESTHLVI